MFGASVAAFACGMVVVFIVLFIMGAQLVSSFKIDMKQEVVKPNTVLYIDLAEDIVDAPRVSTFGVFVPETLTFAQPLTLLHALAAIESAAVDNNIKGLCININGMGSASAANIEELRGAIERFKLSGKFVVAYDDIYTQSDYYLASVADHVILQPEGSLEWRGVAFNSMFVKSLLDKIDAKVEIFRPTGCRYKSAVEIYSRTDMSAADREQMSALANTMWSGIVEDVAASRNIDATELKRLASSLEINLAEEALRAGLVDEIGYEDSLYDYYAEHGVLTNGLDGYNHLSLGEYSAIIHANWTRIPFKQGTDKYDTPYKQPLLAVVYADGNIVDGNMLIDGYVYGSMLAAELRQLRLDENTKAVVLRVNSPGGSALASDVVWREMQLLQQAKPVVVSMGSMAASGGYYISVPADFIYADKLTLTGSIGVFGVMFNFSETLEKHLGITFDGAGTSREANGISLVAELTPRQKEVITEGIDRVYSTFTEHVAEGRNLSLESVLAVAEGRVWSGREALELGLVDGIGGLTESIALAAELADMGGNYLIYELAAPPTALEEMIESISSLFTASVGVSTPALESGIREIVEDNLHLFNYGGIQCVMPNKIELNL